MPRITRLLPALLLGLGALLMWRTRAQAAAPLTGPIAGVLPMLEGYTVTNQRLDSAEQRVAGMSSYVARAFFRDSMLAFTTLVSYYDRQTQGKSIHSPRNCLPGAGWEIMNGGERALNVDGQTRSVNRYVLRNGMATALAYYWYQGRGRITASEYAVKWNLLRDAALEGHTEEALIRVVVYIPRADSLAVRADAIPPASDSLATKVAERLVREVDAILPNRFASRS